MFNNTHSGDGRDHYGVGEELPVRRDAAPEPLQIISAHHDSHSVGRAAPQSY